MTWTMNPINNSIPATHIVPTLDRFARIYFDNEDVVISWTQGSEASLWWLRNYYGTTVASGNVGSSPINLGQLPVGWYKMYFSHSDLNINTLVWGNARGEVSFGVVRHTGVLRNTPIPINEAFNIDAGVQASKVLTGMAQYRVDVRLDSTNYNEYAPSLASAQNQGTLQTNYWLYDSARPRYKLIQFPNGTGGQTPTETDNQQIQGAVASLYGSYGYTHFEARNEPNTGGWTGAGYTAELHAFYDNVKAGNANAQVVGGCSVNLTSNYIDDILSAGAGDYMDVMSVHVYNGTNGNLQGGRDSWDKFFATLAKYNFTKPIWMTEYGQFAYVYGSNEPRLQAQWMTLDLHIAEQHGVPRERYMWYYDANIGYWDYPAFLWTSDYNNTMPTALPIIMRVWSEETFGKPFAEALDFGTVGNDEFIGSRFTASNGTSTIILQSGGGLETLSFDVTGASSLTLVSTFGVESTLTVADGKTNVTVGPEPCYVRLPAGATFVPTAENFGIEVIRVQFAVPTASSQDTSMGYPPVVVDGLISNGEYTGIGAKPYRAASSDTGPSWFRIDFPNVTRLDRVHIYCPHPWQVSGTFLSFQVQWLDPDNVTWHTAYTHSDTSAVDLSFKWSSHLIAGNCFTDSFWPRYHNFRCPFTDDVQTRAIRLYVTAMSAGGNATTSLGSGFGAHDYNDNPVTCGMGDSVTRMSLMEIRAWLSGHTDGGTATAGQKMLLLKGG